MLSIFALVGLAAATFELPSSLKVGDDFYIVGPAIRLGRFITDEKFSPDGQFLTFIDERPEESYASERARIMRGDEPAKRNLVRVNLQTGVRTVLYSTKETETLMSVETVGPSGDIVCSIVTGGSGDYLTWRGIYCAVGKAPNIIVDGVVARSFHFAASTTENKAFVLICGEKETSYLYLTPTQTVSNTLPVTGFQGIFFTFTSNGNPVLGLQGPAPDYKLVGNFELSYKSGQAIALKELPNPSETPEVVPRIKFDIVDRAKANEALDQYPLRDVVALPGDPKNGSGRLVVARGVLWSLNSAPNGAAVTYSNSEGNYVRPILKAEKSLAERLQKRQSAGG